MSIIVERVLVFNKDGGKRAIPFKDGLNIVTGDSKTGKSALIEIVDFCLFSSRSSIPKGKITDFAHLYVLILKVDDKYILIGRPARDNSNYAYLTLEFDLTTLEGLELGYFDNLNLKPIKNDVQTEFEELVGLSVRQLNDSEERPLGKLSIRDTVSFVFQHQNLVANKHAVFYRLDDAIKRKRVIEAMPVLFGAADENYYDLSRQQKNIERQIIAEQKILDRLAASQTNQKKYLEDLIQVYYSLLGLVLEKDLSLAQLRKIGLALPNPPEVLENQSKVYQDISTFQRERELLYVQRDEIEKALNNLFQSTDESFDYAKELVRVFTHQNQSVDGDITCPICSSQVSQLNENIKMLSDSKAKLVDELTKVHGYSKDNSVTINDLKGRKRVVDSDIARLSRNIKQLTVIDEKFMEGKNKREEIIFQRGVIESSIRNYLNENVNGGERALMNDLRTELSSIMEKLKKYNLDEFYSSSEDLLKRNMDRIANKLDFEDELKPINFFFDLKDLSFYHLHNNEKIRLDEMGSGANWLACHLSIFLSFLHLSSSRKKSMIPTFLMFDQPSQVYFPKTASKDQMEQEDQVMYDDNIEQVRKIFRVIDEEVNLIEKEYGVRPQVIVLEHANDDQFRKHIIKEWDKSKGQGLI